MPRCSICGKTEQLLRCSSCKTAHYCSTSHQHIDWPIHKQECRSLAKQKNGARIQQLQQAIEATTLGNSNNMVTNVVTTVADANQHLQQQHQQQQQQQQQYLHQQVTHDGNKVNLTAVLTGRGESVGGGSRGIVVGSSNATVAHTTALPHLSVILGTNENEILHSQAEMVSQNSNSNYFGNFDANSTTMDQMQLLSNGSHLEATVNINNAYTVVGNDLPFDSGDQQQLQPSQHHQQIQQNQQQPLLQQQTNQQYQHQFTLSNHSQNQIEKSSSYQIGQSDENAIGNVNERRYEELCRNIINDMNQYGLSVVDDFLGTEKGLQILNEVHRMYAAGVFKDGQLVNNMLPEEDLRTIRGDKITWVKGVEPGCANVGYLINQIDAVICRANTMRNNGKLGNYNIKERTKAMVACYPGSGSHYIMHVDNPNKDGRVITAIYYLNVNWDTKNSGGVLRIFPEHGNTVADIEPKFDRLIFFWSDKRNPHEVQPAHRTRYAITVWYFDANEREAALNRCKYENTDKTATNHTNATAAKRQATNANPIASSNTGGLSAAAAAAAALAYNAATINANMASTNTANANCKKMNLNNKMANTNVNANTKTQATNQICT